MAKIDPLKKISTGSYDTLSLNENFEKIEDALENTLSRDGSLPNQMEADLDMNSNDILNVGRIDASGLLINGDTVVPSDLVVTLVWRGNWQAGVTYYRNDLVFYNGSTYIVVAEHVSSANFNNDYTAGLLELFASGVGSTANFLQVANNLSDVADVAASRQNLGLEIGVDVQAFDTELEALANTVSAPNKVPYYTGPGTAATLDFLDEDDMISDSAVAVASQQSIKAYVDNQVTTLDTRITSLESGSLVLLQEINTQGLTFIEFLNLDINTYSDFEFHLHSVRPNNANSNLEIEVSDDNGATWGAITFTNSSGITQARFIITNGTYGANNVLPFSGVSGKLEIYNNTTKYQNLYSRAFYRDGNNVNVESINFGQIDANTYNAIRFYYILSGSYRVFQEGVIRLYGRIR